MAKKRGRKEPKAVNPALLEAALAKAVCEGDLVNLHLILAPFSPARKGSTECFEWEKYEYLQPDEAVVDTARYGAALAQVQNEATWTHVLRELEADRPAQLPWELVLLLGDNAVFWRKYTAAAQAYELLRIRRRMQEVFFDQGDEALNNNDVPRAIEGYLVATGLAYDYAAFPEPLPLVPDFQTKALMIHGESPRRPEDCVALLEEDEHTNTALAYLLNDDEAVARLRPLPLDLRLAFLKELVHRCDPDWESFTARYREASAMAQELGERLERAAARQGQDGGSLEEEIEEQMGGDPRSIPAHLLGRTIADGEWWQYLKEIAYEHPAGILFLARQIVGEYEFLIPRYRANSPVAGALGLLREGSVAAPKVVEPGG